MLPIQIFMHPSAITQHPIACCSYVFNGTTMEEQFLIGNLEVINLVLDLANSLIHGLQTQNL